MMTRDQIIAGLEMTLVQAKRTTSLFAEGEWNSRRASGWTPREIYCHLANVATSVVASADAVMRAPEGVDLAQGMDFDQMNARALAGMQELTPEEVMRALEDSYGKLIEFVRSAPDEYLNARRGFLSDSTQVSDILATNVVLHGLHHVYEAYSRVGEPA